MYLLTIVTVANRVMLFDMSKSYDNAKKSFTKLKICQYKDDINEKSYEENIKWIKEIKRACNSDRFKPHFQPIIDNRTGKIVKFEVLLRYKDESGIEIAPSEFLDIAKKARMYSMIIRVVLKNSIAVIKKRKINVSINIAYEDIIDDDTLNLIYKNLKRKS